MDGHVEDTPERVRRQVDHNRKLLTEYLPINQVMKKLDAGERLTETVCCGLLW